MGGAASLCLSSSGDNPLDGTKIEQRRENDNTSPLNDSVPNRPGSISIDNKSSQIESASAVKEVLVTPRREKALYSGVAKTPKGQEIHVYKYFCPICTLYFEDILRSQCCGHYSCIDCTLQYVECKGIKVETASDILRVDDPNLPCLSCSTVGFRPTLVGHDEGIRDYSRNDDESSYQGSTPGTVLNSPVKIGDSYENLKRKMQPFPVVKQQFLFEDGVEGDATENCTLAADTACDGTTVAGQVAQLQQGDVCTNSSEKPINNETTESTVQVGGNVNAVSGGDSAVVAELTEAQSTCVPLAPTEAALVDGPEATAVPQQ